MDEAKNYKIGEKTFTMPVINLGKLQAVQRLIPIEHIENATTIAIWLKLISDNASKVFSIILEDDKGKKYEPSFFDNELLPDNPVIQEVIEDFFTQSSPIHFYLKNMTALNKSFINSVKGKSGEETKS